MRDADLIIQDLFSEEPPRQAVAIEQAAALVDDLAAAAANALERGHNKFIVAERLHLLGPAIVPHLQNIATKSIGQEARVLAALVLLQLKDRTGVPVLLTAVEESSDYAGLCANHLARANIDGAQAAIERRLAAAHLDEVDLVVSLIMALRTMNRELSPDLIRRFKDGEAPWQIRTLL